MKVNNGSHIGGGGFSSNPNLKLSEDPVWKR